MKWNWGTGIVLVMVGFVAFILYFVITMSTDEAYSHDLVTKEYYAKEMVYQDEIDAETNTNNLSEKIKSQKVAEGWLLTFPDELEPTKINGNVFLYRPSNQRLDFEIPMELSSSNLLIPDKRLIDGRWNITIDWTYNGTSFMYKEEISY
ncbi:cytochrome C oxidase Cbb3 [Dokdonia sinensis]|uniref:Cytochrome C oxidase Cbb3 n=1 Tax=Dokdonia sinensis TaxID=2479847 RepID=A0A3M0GN86_9FLAO|nr:FixH family protein [Dokdonia sinensis]RMB64202.1 cytochrome C oxidase Cbb3 [Dokdonia sinensis]